MEMKKVYEDIAKRTDGDIYIGVVGAVRTGKSTFIKQFMEQVVIPGIENVYKKERARDELPQSASGKTIMTAEPKFVPEEAVEMTLEGGGRFKVRLIDCVGYMIPGALGQTEDGAPRMVTTPWFDKEIQMSEAAEIGTRKVIAEHSTVGLVVTTDGTITDFPRESYVEAEGRVINELKEIKKPFIVVINSADPDGEAAKEVKADIERLYGVGAMTVNCLTMTSSDIEKLIKEVLYEFPVTEISVMLPDWFSGLDESDELRRSVFGGLIANMSGVSRIRELEEAAAAMRDIECISDAGVSSIDLGSGTALVRLTLDRRMFYDIIKERTGFELYGESELIPLLSELSDIKKRYDRFAGAIGQVMQTGYSIVEPVLEEMTLEEPEIVRQGGQYGVKLRASAPSVHMMRADICTEIAPIVGTEKQSEELIRYLLSEFDGTPERLWESNIFGKSLHELVCEGLNNKLSHMPAEARSKLRETLQRIINEGSGGLICIIL